MDTTTIRDSSTLRRSFRAMGSTISLTGVGVSDRTMDHGLALAMSVAERWERHFSRFRPDSELSRINGTGGEWVRVSALFMEVLLVARTAWEQTGGRFDPTVMTALTALGYDHDVALLVDRPSARRLPQVVAAPGLAALEINRADSTVRLPPEVSLDFGGIAKGIFADRLADRFGGWPGGAIDAGGDLRVWGESPTGHAWVVDIEDPRDSVRISCQVVIQDGRAGAIATSAFNRRSWRIGDTRYHHLIDPETGMPVAGSFVSATAVAPDLATAEVATKALLVSGARGEPLWLAAATSAAVLIDAAGSVYYVGGEAPDACRVLALDPEARAS